MSRLSVVAIKNWVNGLMQSYKQLKYRWKQDALNIRKKPNPIAIQQSLSFYFLTLKQNNAMSKRRRFFGIFHNFLVSCGFYDSFSVQFYHRIIQLFQHVIGFYS